MVKDPEAEVSIGNEKAFDQTRGKLRSQEINYSGEVL
jgi:hypothetical protein